MDSRLSNFQHRMMKLPPLDASVVAPPTDDMSSTSSRDASLPSGSGCLESEGLSELSRSEGVSTTRSIAKGKQRRRPSSSSSSPQIGRNTPPRNPSLIFAPRPFENLYTERAYLTTTLQEQSSRVVYLIREYSIVERQLEIFENAKDRRRTRRKLGLLRSKISRAVEQEKTIFNRLGELYVEIQTRESWNQASHSRSSSIDSYFSAETTPSGPYFDAPSTYYPETPSAYSTGTFSPYGFETPPAYAAMSPASYGCSAPNTPLNAMSPSFFPQGYFPWQPTEGTHDGPDSPGGLATVHEDGEEILYSPGMPNPVEQAPLDCQDVMEEAVDDAPSHRRLSFNMGEMAVRERRLSLPCLQTVWQ